MSPWLSILLLGAAIFGFAWLSPRRAGGAGENDPAYDRLLEDLETENREMVDAVSKFKEEQDETVGRLVKQIVDLERQMKTVAEQSAATQAVQTAALALAAQTPIQPAAVPAPPPAELKMPSQSVPEVVQETIYAPASIRVRYAELLSLHNKGRSVEQIAKSVGMNKGEVQLILQLARREEEQHA